MSSIAAPRRVQAPRRPGVRAAVARRVVAVVADRVPVQVRLPDGTLLGRRSTDPEVREGWPVLELVRPDAFFARLGRHPKIGIGEGYVAGDWRAGEGTDLADLLVPFAARLTSAVPPGLARFRRLVDRRIPAAQRNSLRGSRSNIEAHYDLSNELFGAFLDETLTYSSALFDPSLPLQDQDLAQAQLRKVHAILDRAGVGRGTRLLEIGTGWGTLAIEAARRGALVTTVTLSQEQAHLARQRVTEAGLADRVEVRLEDYREVAGSYDAIVSVEMIEAVGEEFWPTYFAALDRLLAPGGTVALQAITMSHERYLATRRSYGWIQKHIFPGGLIPSLEAIQQVTTRGTTLRVDEVHRFGTDYAETLQRWRRTFTEQWPTISRRGFDEAFRRTWEFYLAYCEAGFATGYLDVVQLRLRRPAEAGTPAAPARGMLVA
ncbi:MAG TPA: cyclopropane-fatty-acyl-phospholipid synthase family protein [Nocardioides sp.]|uniref:cyclopropane-fatty-acyl-phospholipid synthase family protein n=1 Tax=Nocardioides sp. TaxID=35761 RepID=UPI002C06344C|nr:cyclopropane-fatty-acyl-phospholipid synthase family protein [Nocardioides sp.]HQR28397.1 cyclopropane-fatty-acyl-phospholipid synthase family protein [Nocardioides sp.]